MNIIDRLKAKVKGFFKRETIYNIRLEFPVEVKVSEKTFKPLDHHIPIEQKFGNRLMKVEH